jgi:hypothetical protein
MRNLIFVLVICSLVFSACSKKDKSVTGPDMGDENWAKDYQKVLYVIYEQDYKGSYAYGAQIWIKNASDTDSPPMLIIKEIVCPWESYGTTTDGTWYHYNVPDPAMYDYGAANNYTFIFRDITYSGTITMPYRYNATFPIYAYNSDYIFTWELTDSPDQQWLLYLANYKDQTHYTFNKQISISDRTYSIPADKLQDIVSLAIVLKSYNICENSSSLLVLTLSISDHAFYTKGMHAKASENNLFKDLGKKVVDRYNHKLRF